MTRLRRFEDAAVAGRLDRLRRSELDLEARLRPAIVGAERAGSWVPTDPSCKRLSLLLRQVHVALAEAEKEHARRGLAGRQPLKPVPLTRGGRTSSVLGPKTTNP